MHLRNFNQPLLATCLAGLVFLGGSPVLAHPTEQMAPSAVRATPEAPGVEPGYSDLWLAAFAAWEKQHQEQRDFNTQGHQQYEALLVITGRDLEALGLVKAQFGAETWRQGRMEALEQASLIGGLSPRQARELELLARYEGLAYGITLWSADQARLAEERTLVQRLMVEPALRLELLAFQARHGELDEAQALLGYVERKRAGTSLATAARDTP